MNKELYEKYCDTLRKRLRLMYLIHQTGSRDVAKKLGVTELYFTKIVTEKNAIPLHVLTFFRETFNITADWILYGDLNGVPDSAREMIDLYLESIESCTEHANTDTPEIERWKNVQCEIEEKRGCALYPDFWKKAQFYFSTLEKKEKTTNQKESK